MAEPIAICRFQGKRNNQVQIRVPVGMNVFREGSAPLVFRLHMHDGYAHELEIFMADSSKIDFPNLVFQRIEYEVNPELRLPK